MSAPYMVRAMTDSLIEELAVLLKHVIDTYCPIEYKDKADAKDQINAFIKAMGDASTRKDEGATTGVTPSDICTANSSARCEISLNNAEGKLAFYLWENVEFLTGNRARQIIDYLRPYLRQPEPVSIRECAKGYFSHMAGDKAWAWDNLSENEKMSFDETCKIVLDAAGVKYVD